MDAATDDMIEMTASMIAMLEWWAEQPCSCATIGWMADEIEYSRETVRSNLKLLMAAGHVEQMHKPTGAYRLVEDPRDN
jgi:DNA-binding IclR family transcriptional regulator